MFDQLKKNTVSARNQLKESDYVTFENLQGEGPRVMFVGNSITLHGILPSIGWHIRCGMAASAPENDYVHLMMDKIRNKHDDAAFCICQVASWEGDYKKGSSLHHLYEGARQFEADIIVMRFVENCPHDEFDGEIFKKETAELIKYLDASGNAKIIVTTGFWKHPGNPYLIDFANENGLPLAKLEDLGEDDKMKAIGLFEHGGVANHPGDLGMKMIAERIYEKMENML